MAKITDEDVNWLEGRLREAIQPKVSPRPEFVSRAKRELMDLPIEPKRKYRSSVLVGIVFSLAALVAAILLLRRRG
jgi:hypothetical protein